MRMIDEVDEVVEWRYNKKPVHLIDYDHPQFIIQIRLSKQKQYPFTPSSINVETVGWEKIYNEVMALEILNKEVTIRNELKLYVKGLKHLFAEKGMIRNW